MADREEMTYEEFVAAAKRVAVVLADLMWRRSRDELTPLRLPPVGSAWLDSKAARKHVRFGETKFRELIKAGVLPQGTKVGGKLMWNRDELDRRMASYFRKQRRANRSSRPP
jgi:hypothetical protein